MITSNVFKYFRNLFLVVIFTISVPNKTFGDAVQIYGFETCDSGECSAFTSVGSFFADATGAISGVCGLRLDTTGKNVQNCEIQGLDATGYPIDFNLNLSYLRANVFYGQFPNSVTEELFTFLDTSDVVKFYLFIDPSGFIEIRDGSLSIQGTSSTALTILTIERIEVVIPNSSDQVLVYLNGVLVLTSSNFATGDALGSIKIGRTIGSANNDISYNVDDIQINDSQLPGPGKILKMGPNEAGYISDWTGGTGTTFAEIVEIPTDNTTTTLADLSGAGAASYFELEDTGAVGISGTIAAIKAWGRAIEGIGTPGQFFFSVGVRSSGVNDINNYATPGSLDFNNSYRVWANDFNSAAPWDLATLDALQIGVQNGSIISQIIDTTNDVFVDFDDSATPTPTPTPTPTATPTPSPTPTPIRLLQALGAGR